MLRLTCVFQPWQHPCSYLCAPSGSHSNPCVEHHALPLTGVAVAFTATPSVKNHALLLTGGAVGRRRKLPPKNHASQPKQHPRFCKHSSSSCVKLTSRHGGGHCSALLTGGAVGRRRKLLIWTPCSEGHRPRRGPALACTCKHPVAIPDPPLRQPPSTLLISYKL